MKKRITAILMAVLILLTTFQYDWTPMGQAEAADNVSVTIHYRRFDANYENWNVWLWPDGGDGSAYEFTGEDEYGVVLQTELTGVSAEKLGFIVRLGEWELKDVDADRFIDISDGSGAVEIYLLEGDATIYTSADAVDMSPTDRKSVV